MRCVRANCPRGLEIYLNAARGGHLDVLKWARANSCEWSKIVAFGICHLAAGTRFLDVLKWAVANGGEFGVDACRAAAEYGRVHVLEWLTAHGCAWDRARCCMMAALSGRLVTARCQRSGARKSTF